MRAIEFKNVSFRYEDMPEPVLKNASFSLEYGKLALLYGDSGQGKSTVLSILSGVIPNVIKGTLSGEVRVGGEEPAAYIRKYTGRAPVVHLKDYAGGKSEHMYELIGIQSEHAPEEHPFEFRPVGSGVQDIPAILAAADDAGAKWLVVEQDQPSMGLTPMECARASIGYLRGL